MWIRVPLFCVAALAACVVALPTATSATFDVPSLEVGGDYSFLNEPNNLSFWLQRLQFKGAADEVAITVPPQFTASLARAVGTRLGSASVVAIPHPGTTTTYTGHLAVSSAAGFHAAWLQAGCSPSVHAASWRLVLETKSGEALNIPIGVGRTTAGTRMDICLGGLVAAGLTPSSVYFQTNRTFRNPADTATYPIVAEVTPTAAKSYDLVGDDPLPEQLFVQSDRSKTGQITVTGALRGGGFPRPRMRVNVYGGAGTDASKWHLIGSAVTRADGSYRLIRRAPTVKYLYAFVGSSLARACTVPGKPPGGCVSHSISGISTAEAAVSVDSQR
jgi:hypothetical protein